MASVSGVSNSNMSSLYGNRNVISGLASGMDTESMINNSVSGIRLKISGIQQKQTKLQWKQEAYQGVTDTLIQFSRKYTSYSSATNLLSPSFFNKAVLTTTGGANASKVSASGRSTSNVQINGVAQLATYSRYQVENAGVLEGTNTGLIEVADTKSVNLNEETTVSNLTGSLTLNYGTKSVSIDFAEDDKLANATEFLATINAKLAAQKITTSSGTTEPASDFIEAKLDGNKITFSDKTSGHNDVYIEGTTGRIADTFVKTVGKDVNSIDLAAGALTGPISIMEKLGGKTMSFTLDGVSKNITLPTKAEIDAKGGSIDEAFTALLQDKLNTAFGSNKIKVEDKNATAGVSALRLSFSVNPGSSLSISSAVNETLNLDKLATTYLNTSKTLGDLLGNKFAALIPGGAKPLQGIGEPKKQADGSYRDQEGNVVDAARNRLGKDGNQLFGVDLKINGQVIGTYHRDTPLETVMLGIKNNTQAGVSLNYSKTTNQFVFSAKDTGAGHSISYDNSGLAKEIFGEFKKTSSNYSEGKDAIVNMSVNGKNMTVTRSSNTFDVDGMSVTVKETFNFTNYEPLYYQKKDVSGNLVFEQKVGADGKPMFEADNVTPIYDATKPVYDKTKPVYEQKVDAAGKPMFESDNVTPIYDTTKPVYDKTKPIFDVKDPVTFTSSSDEDKIVTAIKEMVKDYNNIVTELRKSFNTLPAKKTNGKKYEPLTDKDRESMTESAIKAYEEKAKQGLLFGDQDLSSMYSKLVSSISPPGTDGTTLRSMGITTDYSQGLTTLNLDETKLRDMLKTNPDTVRDSFTKVSGEGSSTDGLMKKLKTTLDTYSSVEGTRGILINKAGSKYSALSLLKNATKDQLDTYEKQVDKLQGTLSKKVDYYTRQYTRLEQLISKMNSQSSSIAGMGG